MQSINLTLTVEQIKALLQIGQNQLFRMKFVDPKMPGYKSRPGELEAAESAVQALTATLKGGQVEDTRRLGDPRPLWTSAAREVRFAISSTIDSGRSGRRERSRAFCAAVALAACLCR